MKTRVAPSVALEQEIAQLLEQGISNSEDIARLGRLGAQLVLQKGIEDEVADFLQRVRYERTVQARGPRNGNRPKHVMTAEGELEVQMPQLRNTAVKFVSRVIPDAKPPILRYEPGNPDADAKGYVAYPAIDPVEEMTDLLGAVRAYELNASAVQAAKSMIQQSLGILQ